MFLNLTKPIIYLITDGTLSNESANSQKGFTQTIELILSAVSAKISLIQIREKNLSAKSLFELTKQASQITKNTETLLLVNDRADVALAANADGVHLTSNSMRPLIIRKTFPENFIVGVSTHSVQEAKQAKAEGAHFALFGHVFDTPSKREYGLPAGLAKLKEVSETLKPFPVIAIGGITLENTVEIFQHGAIGIAAIRMLNDAESLEKIVQSVRKLEKER